MSFRIKNQAIAGFAFLLLLFSVASCDRAPSESSRINKESGNEVPDAEKPVIAFKETTFNFQKVNEGEEVTHEFEFTNEGKSDLLISKAVASCGCTVPDWPKEPIPPGKGGKIKATFNTEGKQGQQKKTIVITANTKPEQTDVYLEGEVIPKENKNQ
jgi:hypothetical protein